MAKESACTGAEKAIIEDNSSKEEDKDGQSSYEETRTAASAQRPEIHCALTLNETE